VSDDPLQSAAPSVTERPTFALEDRGFLEVPKKWRKYYRHWEGDGDSLAPNEIVCPVCKVVIRSRREIRAGDRLYCMPCMSRLLVVDDGTGSLALEVVY
jgi:hypothetical protein